MDLSEKPKALSLTNAQCLFKSLKGKGIKALKVMENQKGKAKGKPKKQREKSKKPCTI